ncbi:MAG: hypothetical protein OQJ98_03270 [Candidatus Pacebacteria bacterium]|nr:hypothetical protein [Candidatus Paceibacterota bacterium]
MSKYSVFVVAFFFWLPLSDGWGDTTLVGQLNYGPVASFKFNYVKHTAISPNIKWVETSRGHGRILSKGELLLWEVSLMGGERRGNFSGQSVNEKFSGEEPQIHWSMQTDPLGHVRESEIKFASSLGTHPQISQAIEGANQLFSYHFRAFKPGPLNIYNELFDGVDVAQFFSSFGVPSDGLSGEFKNTAMGLGKFGNRKAVREEMEGFVRGSFNGIGMDIQITGEGWIDAVTGLPLSRKLKTNGSMRINDQTVSTHSDEVWSLEITSDEPVRSDGSQKSSTDQIEEKLIAIKRLVEKGLITEEEAKRKRIEILNGL